VIVEGSQVEPSLDHWLLIIILAEGTIKYVIVSVIEESDKSVVVLPIVHLLLAHEVGLQGERDSVDQLLSRFSSLVLNHNAQDFVREHTFELDDHFMRVTKLDHINEFLVAVDEGPQLHLIKV